MNSLSRIASYLIFLVCLPLVSVAQTASPSDGTPQAPPAATPSPTPTPTPASSLPESPKNNAPPTADQEKEILKQEQSQRILGVAPMFGTTSRLNAPALTTGQKFHLFAKSSFDPFEYAAAGFQAGLGQWTDEFPGYGQGAEGYAKRYGASLADQVSSNFFSNFVYPTLLKEDPRYFRLGEGSIKHRIVYSLAQEFVCHTDSGGRSFNYSNVFGAFTSGGISNLYYPSTDRGFGLTMSRSAISLLYGSAGGLIDEFWPDVDRKLFHRHPKEAR